ncbi:MAG TPA: PAS domain S-box protein, partial [Hyphomicrobiales bacterium]|nr:PAS domain S-box protein [Hyphomicrobiales bacterium]
VAAAVDAKLEEDMSLARTLSRSPALLDSNLDVFDAEARRAFPGEDAWVAVMDLDGQQLINTSSQPGQRLPRRNALGVALQKRALETRSILISDLRLGQKSNQWIVSIEVPIFKNGEPFRQLSVAVNAALFLRLLNQQHLPKNWLAGIVDGENRFIAHVPSEGRSPGEFVSEGSRKYKDQEGVFEFASLNGDPIILARAHSALSGWTAGIAVKKAEMRAAAWNASRWALLLGVGFTTLSLLLAGVIARSISNPIDKLRKKAAAVTAGPPLFMRSVDPPEVKELWRALVQSTTERDCSEAALRANEEKLRLALDAAELGTWRWEAAAGDKELHWDTRCKALFGLPADAHVTWKTWSNSILAEDRQQAEANVAHALDPGNPQDETVCEFRVRHPDGTVHWLCSTGRVYFVPDRASPSGRRVAFKAGVIRDVTAAHLAEAALRESEERLRLSNEAAGIGTFMIDVESGCVHYSPELAAMLGFPGLTTTKVDDAFTRIHREDIDRARAQYEAALRGVGEGRIKTEFRFVRPGGEVRWMTWAGRMHFRDGPTGSIPFRIDGACVDITEGKRTEEALRESEERFRGVFERAATGIVIRDMDDRFLSCNPAFCAIIGYSQEELRALSFASYVHPDDQEANLAECRRLAAGEISSIEIVNRCVRKDGKPIWVHKYISLLKDAAGRPTNILVLVTDITEHKQQDDQIRLLMREVNHRSKNILSVVQAIARQTVAANPEDFVERFGKRVEALAANQDLLVKNAWRGVVLHDLVLSQLAHFQDLIGTRIAVEGPTDVFVSASAAQSLGMALHELATNAAKYGALSDTDGHVEIAWAIECDEQETQMFVMSWRERCAHPVKAPSKLGFGFSVISTMAQMALDAKVELDFPPEGLTWRLRCAASQAFAHTIPSGPTPAIEEPRSKQVQNPHNICSRHLLASADPYRGG